MVLMINVLVGHPLMCASCVSSHQGIPHYTSPCNQHAPVPVSVPALTRSSPLLPSIIQFMQGYPFFLSIQHALVFVPALTTKLSPSMPSITQSTQGYAYLLSIQHVLGPEPTLTKSSPSMPSITQSTQGYTYFSNMIRSRSTSDSCSMSQQWQWMLSEGCSSSKITGWRQHAERQQVTANNETGSYQPTIQQFVHRSMGAPCVWSATSRHKACTQGCVSPRTPCHSEKSWQERHTAGE